MSVLKVYFDPSVNQCSPTRTDYQRVVNYDDSGNEFITYVPVDYASIVASHGFVSDWSLNSLLKAGIDPSFGIHTGFNTRLEGVSVVNELAAQSDSILTDNSNA